MARLHFRGHIGKRDYAVNTAPPTISGSAISGQTLTRGAGTWTPVESIITGYVYEWQSADAPDFTNWSDIVGANAITFLASGTEIGKKLRVGEAAVNGDGPAPFVYSNPTAIVQDAPAIPLAITGTPVTAANQNALATFQVSFDGGEGVYTPTLLNAPSGSSVTLNADNETATVTLSTANVGSFGGIVVRVSDGTNTADLASFTFSVVAVPVGSYLTVVPGAGWSGTTSVGSNFGNPSGVGYGHKPTIRYNWPPFDTFTAPFILWIYARHTGDLSAYNAVGNPTYGIDHVRVSADNGAWLTIPAQYNTADQAWGFPVRIDPAMWADGVPSLTSTGQRTLRIIARPKNGNEAITQDLPGKFFQAFRFSTNANGSLSTPIRYVKNSGNDASDGLTEGTARKTIEGALASIGSTVNGAIIEITEAGNYAYSASTARTANTRHVIIRGKASLPQNAVVLNSQGSNGIRANLVRLKHLKTNQIIQGNNGGDATHTWFDDVLMERAAGYANVNNGVDGGVNPYAASAGRVYFTGGRINEYANAFRGAYIVNGTSCGKIGSDLFTNCQFAINVLCDEIMAGDQLLSPGNPDPVNTDNFHPDAAQYLGSPVNVAGSGWTYGAILINTTIPILDGQGPFFKDTNYVDGIFIENAHWDMSANTSRNDLSVWANNHGSPNFPRTILRNSHFWDCEFYPGNGGRGTAGNDGWEDVIWKNVRVNGSKPAPVLLYQAYTP